MPRSRNLTVEAASATSMRRPLWSWPWGAFRSLSAWILVAGILPATPSRGQGPRQGAEPQGRIVQSVVTTPGPSHATGPPEADVAALRAQTSEQLKALEVAPPPAATTAPAPGGAGTRTGSAPPPAATAAADTATDRQLRDLLKARLNWLDEYDKAAKELKKASNPEPNPDQQAAEARKELSRLQAVLAQAARQPETLLPSAYRGRVASGPPALNAEMKDALEATRNELKEWKSKLEALRAEGVSWEGRQAARRGERDRLFQQVTMLRAREVERAAVAAATTARARRLAHERLINAEWQARAEALRLQALEAQLALEAKLASVRDVTLQVYQARIQVAEQALALMQERYRAAAELQERDLSAQAAHEENLARGSQDPLQRFRAHRLAELLELEALVVKHEQALATNPAPSLDEQRGLADRAEADFARIKELLDDGRVSRLDAFRLNHEFRRIGPERDRLLRNEMAVVEARLQYYEDALTNVEIELLQDSLHDRFEHDLLRERLPAARAAEAEALLAEVERKHRALLVRRRAALERLTDATAQTLDQVARRLRILDEEYGFIRTHIFWVRDQEPIGLATLSQGARELQQVLKALVRLGQETTKPPLWGRASAEFLIATLAALGLPPGLVRLRRALHLRIRRELPARGESARRHGASTERWAWAVDRDSSWGSPDASEGGNHADSGRGKQN